MKYNGNQLMDHNFENDKWKKVIQCLLTSPLQVF